MRSIYHCREILCYFMLHFVLSPNLACLMQKCGIVNKNRIKMWVIWPVPSTRNTLLQKFQGFQPNISPRERGHSNQINVSDNVHL
jgi:hypothetical protein